MTNLQSIDLAWPRALVCGWMHGARGVPAMKDGKLDGFKLYATRRIRRSRRSASRTATPPSRSMACR
jgi:hypothetical protein